MKENKNLRGSFLVLVSAIFFAAFGFIGESGNAQTKNAKKTPPPSKAKSPTPAKKETSSKTTKTDSNSKSAKTAKTAEKSKSAKEKTASSKDKKSNKNTAESKSKQATTAKNSKPTAKPSSSEEKQASAKKSTEKAKPAEKKPVKAAQPTVAKSIKTPQSDNTKPAKKEDTRQIIVKATSAQIRAEPSMSATTVSFAKLGSRYAMLEQTADWYKVRLSDSNKAGWISIKVAGDFDSARRETIYEDLIKKYYKEDEKDFAVSAEVFEFLTAARNEAKDEKTKADLSFKRYLALRCALRAVPSGKSEENPYKDFLKKTDEEIVYSEPSAEWLVRANLLWELYSTYPKLPISEEIAWQAARNPIPGECEGYTNCYIYLIRVTDGEYLNFYPNGKHAEQALKHITDFLEPIASDAEERKIYTAPSDTSDRADFNQLLTELRGIISKLPYAEKGKAIQQINKIAEGYR